jgi:hypothetical protein
VKTLLATIHVAFVGCHGNLVYRVVSWIPVLGNLWEVPWKETVTSLLFMRSVIVLEDLDLMGDVGAFHGTSHRVIPRTAR